MGAAGRPAEAEAEAARKALSPGQPGLSLCAGLGRACLHVGGAHAEAGAATPRSVCGVPPRFQARGWSGWPAADADHDSINGAEGAGRRQRRRKGPPARPEPARSPQRGVRGRWRPQPSGRRRWGQFEVCQAAVGSARGSIQARQSARPFRRRSRSPSATPGRLGARPRPPPLSGKCPARVSASRCRYSYSQALRGPVPACCPHTVPCSLGVNACPVSAQCLSALVAVPARPVPASGLGSCACPAPGPECAGTDTISIAAASVANKPSSPLPAIDVQAASHPIQATPGACPDWLQGGRPEAPPPQARRPQAPRPGSTRRVTGWPHASKYLNPRATSAKHYL